MIPIWLKAVSLSVLAFMLPIQALVIGAISLVILNTLSGVAAAKKRGKAITAAAWSRPLAKLIFYPIAILVGHIVGVVMLGALVPVAGIVAGAIGTAELGSCLRNVSALTGVSVTEAVISRVSSAIDGRQLATESDPKRDEAA